MTRIIRRMVPHVAFLVLLSATVALAWGVHGDPFPATGVDSLWFYSGLVMLLFAMFYVEPHYGAPKNAMAHSIAVLLVLLAVREDFAAGQLSQLGWRVLLIYAAIVLGCSWLASNIETEHESPSHWSNRSAELLKDVSVLFGEARVLYSGVFLLFLPTFHQLDEYPIMLALVFWWFIVMINPQKRLTRALANFKLHRSEIAHVTGVQSRHVFLAKAVPNTPMTEPLQTVEFAYAVEDGSDTLKRGIVLANYLLEDEQWLKVLELSTVAGAHSRVPNAIHHVPLPEDDPLRDVVARFVGVVVEGSEIGAIKFELIPGGASVQEGDLVEVTVREARVLYQIVNAQTGKELLEDKNEGGFVRAEAVQLGRWNPEECAFEKFGWLPDMTAPVLRARPDMEMGEPQYPEAHLGVLPGTDVPVFIDVKKAHTHHLAILGITGSGKSFIAFEILRAMVTDTKVICVDFTGEYMERLDALAPSRFIDGEAMEEVERMMADRADAGKARLLELKRQIQTRLTEHVQEFIAAEHQLAVFELPDLSNTSFILEFTQLFLEAVFHYAKEHVGNQICLVLEEAHTVIPETSSLGDFGDYSSNKALVNKIGQIALQGRKYGVGFVVIAQRTANVSKTVLTQCNSMICFQAFDETSYRFLENHLGTEMVKALPRLRPYHAITVGKAFRGNIPLIVDLKRERVEPRAAAGEAQEEDGPEVLADITHSSGGNDVV